MRYKLFILTLIGSYTFGQGGFMFKRPKPELIEKKPPLVSEINVDSVSLKINDNLNLVLKNESDSLTINDKKEEKIVGKGFPKTEVLLNINTIPERVEVSIDGKLIGKTPILGKKIISGFHTFEINKEGLELIYNKLNKTLANQGLKSMDSIEKEFDADIHEAITKIPAPKENLKGKVIDVIEKGYTINEKVIRFAKVVVGE